MKRGISNTVNVDELFTVIKEDWSQFIRGLTANASRLAVNQIYKGEKLAEASFKLRYLNCLPLSKQTVIAELVPGKVNLRVFIENLAKNAPVKAITRRVSQAQTEIERPAGPLTLHSDFEDVVGAEVSDYSSSAESELDEEKESRMTKVTSPAISKAATSDVSDYSDDEEESESKKSKPLAPASKPSSGSLPSLSVTNTKAGLGASKNKPLLPSKAEFQAKQDQPLGGGHNDSSFSDFGL